ncbi:MAG TPA: BatA domain-containing protein, partial [Candidatus Binatia bacterium]|nr:BatA domain-containing protein [Candidatus Binatia bacterium]
LIRRRPQRVIFSSLLLFADLSPQASRRPWGKLRLPPMFYLQLLLLVLLILSLGEPVFSVHPSKVAIVLDNSASMQALEGTKTRFTLAQEQARGVLTDLAATARVDVYVTVPRLEKVLGENFSPSEAAAAIAILEPYDMSDGAADFGTLLSGLAPDQNYDRIFFLTDRPGQGSRGNIRLISVGQPKGNLSISSFQITRSSLVKSQLEANVEVSNFSPKDEKVKINLKGNDRVLSSRELFVRAGSKAVAIFEGFPSNSYYEAEIATKDALALDNHRFALPPQSDHLRILAISPRPQSLASLRSIPGLSIELISPSEYERSRPTGYSLEIFHYAAPAAVPANNALFVLPPDNNPLVALEKATARSVISGWREGHPLTRYVNFALFRPTYARALKPRGAGQSIIESPEGPLVIALERQEFRYLILGFEPFPYLGKDNLPVSIFTLNLLDWFSQRSGAQDKATGEPLTFSAALAGEMLVTPKGEKRTLKVGANTFPATYFQGIYQMDRGRGKRELFAVNLHDINESDLREPVPIELRATGGSVEGKSLFFSFWPYLLLLSLMLLVLEWFLNRPTGDPSLPSRSLETSHRL